MSGDFHFSETNVSNISLTVPHQSALHLILHALQHIIFLDKI
jgi:hypothetical protein